MFLPTTPREIIERGWDRPDIIFVTGDTYIDVPSCGVALLGKFLERFGFRVAVIAQPDMSSGADITRLGEPRLFWGVTGGSIDSMVANFTASGKRRKSDDLTPGGINSRRPDRAVIRYVNLIREFTRTKKLIVLGGIEASLRRIAHYDFWSDSIRRSVLFDAKADILVYGMAEKTLLELTRALDRDEEFRHIRGLCYIASESIPEAIELPSYEEAAGDPEIFSAMFLEFYRNADWSIGKRLVQKHGNRYLVHNPPMEIPTADELDDFYASDFELDVHPFYGQDGLVRALDTVRFSLTTHRGCYGECSFCAIAVHQGRDIISRSETSIIAEAERYARHRLFRGTISDVGGPTANMYGFDCGRRMSAGSCRNRHCLGQEVCPALKVNHRRQIDLLRRLRGIPKVKHVFVSSGIRYDLILADHRYGVEYLDELVNHHISGQLRVAPEHVSDEVLEIMGKGSISSLEKFREIFSSAVKRSGKESYLTYYFIAAHPGCTEEHMRELSIYVGKKLKTKPQGLQIFTPTPSTISTSMYFTGRDPLLGKQIFVEKNPRKRERQKTIVLDGEQINPPVKKKR